MEQLPSGGCFLFAMLRALQLTCPGLFENLDLTLQVGETVGLAGPNGSGKSTLLRLLGGLLPAPSGSLEVAGWNSEDPGFRQACRRHIGMVFQNPESQLVANTVEEEVAFAPGQLGLPRPELETRVREALERVGLLERRLWQSHALSAGQKQRLALAAVLAQQPDLLLLDEPFSMLDPPARTQLLELLTGLAAAHGILIVSHHAQVLRRCQRVLVLQQGVLREFSDVPALFSDTGLLDEVGLEHPPRLPPAPYPALPYRPTAKPTAGEPFAQLTGLEHTYAKDTPLAHRSLHPLELTLRQGATTALIGHTGSGKSTLIQHLNLLLRPAAGQLWLLGESIAPQTPVRPLRKRIGLLFQQPETQFFQETVAGEIAFAPRNFGCFNPDTVAMALQQLQLPPDLSRRSPFELSGGEQRLVALASVLAYDPEVLLLDEPTAGLDPSRRRQLWQLLKAWRQGSRSLVFISHDLEEVAELADDVVWLENGRLQGQGSPGQLFPQLGKAGFELPIWSSAYLTEHPEYPCPTTRDQFFEWLASEA